MAKRAAKYRRISQDREGRELGIQRQDEDLDDLADRRDLDFVAGYSDNDIGASTRSRRPRPDYRRMLEDARAGKFEVIAAYTSGRLTRRPREFEDLIDLATEHGIEFMFIRSPEFDLTTAQGRRIARMLAAQDAGEAEEAGERIARAARQRAEQGLNHGGRRCYGYGLEIGRDHTGQPIVDYGRVIPAEAAEVRWMAEQLLAGVPLGKITRELNARGSTTIRGKAWSTGSVRTLLMWPRLAGLAQHKGTIVGKGQWEAILTEDQHHAIVALLTDPARRTSTGNRAGYLLSGLALCAVCDAPVTANGQKRNTPGGRARHMYRCRTNYCVGRRRDWVDDYVTFRIFERLIQADAVELLVDHERPDLDALNDEAHAIRIRLDQAAAAFARGTIDDRQLEIATAEMNERLQEIDTLRQHTSRAPILRPLIEAAAQLGEDASQEERLAAVEPIWAGYSLDRRRAVVQCLVTVRLHPGGGGHRKFDPTKVEVIPKD